MFKNIVIVILGLSLLVNMASSHLPNHKCIHNEIAKEYIPSFQSLNLNKGMLGFATPANPSTAQSLRVHIDTSQLTQGSDQQLAFIKSLLLSTSEFFEKRLKVNRVQGKLTIGQDQCYQATVAANLKTGGEGVDADLIVIATSGQIEGSTLAWASSCVFEDSGRPIAGQVHFNLNLLNEFSHRDYLKWLDTLIHEVTHILVFSPHLYTNFIDENGNKRTEVLRSGTYRGHQGSMIVTPNVVQVAKDHFNCPTAEGAEIENEGGSGSKGAHWEKAIFKNEVMTSQSEPNGVFSTFTMALLRDSGWYIPVTELAQSLVFGKDAGCDILTSSSCISAVYKGYCDTQGEKGCTFDRYGAGQCSTNAFTVVDGCSVIEVFSNRICSDTSQNSNNMKLYGQLFGQNSKCIEGNFIKEGYTTTSQNGCYPIRCDANNNVFITVESEEKQCTSEGQQLTFTGFSGSLKCPPPNICLTMVKTCPNHCSSKGFCYKGACECNKGFTGDDCSQSDSSSTSTSTSTTTTSTTTTSTTCSDLKTKCPRWQQYCTYTSYKATLKIYCPKTCGYC